ncbi:superoxide dismutase [Fe] [Sneathiella chungangensis]|uniref:Superoxide dismutase n=1 Tax=Sneathiella chungangensis TaxID=1418234 RepID=A0A845MGM2_9PROT|nr:superoxide dismutase [Sneathiella chungangensis]MZR22772.1 superoxide dismutase [Fe] [Sneathiella chungangensis]
MPILLPDLPYAYDALEPYISAAAMEIHYGKHHRAYVSQVNYLERLRQSVHDIKYQERTLEEILDETAGQARFQRYYNNAAQAWNHTFFWHSMSPMGGGMPFGDIKEKIIADFGDYDAFAHQFRNAALDLFGCGWLWLVLENDVLRIIQTSNADTPALGRQTPLLTIDLWEHAFYLDYQNKRSDYIDVFLERLINWEFVNSNIAKLNRARCDQATKAPWQKHCGGGDNRFSNWCVNKDADERRKENIVDEEI